MAAVEEDSINFNKLERELDAALEADAKYSRENNAKFRAVHQKVASYDEFRDIVLASHLKPLEKKDRINNMKFQQPWNVHANGKSSSTCETTQLKTSKNIPKSSHEFAKEWRRLKTCAEKCGYLLFVGKESLGKMFKTEIAFGLLGEIVSALETKEDTSLDFIFDILETLSDSGRFQLSLQFLSSKESETVKNLFDRIGKLPDLDRSRLDIVKEKFRM